MGKQGSGGKIEWRKLHDYRCPMPDCGALMKEFKVDFVHSHECTACRFKVSDNKLKRILNNG